MAAESWWSRPADDSGFGDSRLQFELVPQIPTHMPANTPMPEGCIRTRAEVEHLRDQAVEEMARGDWGDDPQALIDDTRLTNLATNRPDEAARGIRDISRWLLGETTTGPMTGLEGNYPYQEVDLRPERHAAIDVWRRDVPLPPGPEGQKRYSYVEGVFYTFQWCFKDYGTPPKRPLKLAPGED